MDYERIWNAFIKTDKKLLIALTISNQTPLSEAFYRKFDLGAPSTVYSSLKRLMQNGTILKSEKGYGIDDPTSGKTVDGPFLNTGLNNNPYNLQHNSRLILSPFIHMGVKPIASL